eukprot:TRINITY_DN13042_c0_g1_i1.p1 TRINITY_DN13042_c0_g1~~TRINITY_DN13042_c0_g1_i1.p1  ORF type:complete len:461 (+),score=169.98 TRINITY_DN13042_c0_g1_i1:93-1475(+)
MACKIDAQAYLRRHNVPDLVDRMIARLVEEQPADPPTFIAAWLLRESSVRCVTPLRCAVQNYAWGMKGSTSEVAQLHAAGSGGVVDEAKPYAELWMGTHPSGPSLVGDMPLKEWLMARKEQALGSLVASRWGDLPFLFKVLSVNTALSIQAHPDKANAERLHARDPKNYKDDNHKPEMAVALTPFEAMCGFVSPEELKAVLRGVPEVREVVGAAAAEAYCSHPAGDEAARKRTLRDCFGTLMKSDSAAVARAVRALAERLRGEQRSRQLTEKEDLALRLSEQYPDDVGVLGCFFLNRIILQPGEAMYLPANEPHAYVKGNIVECMAASDNVVRAGLTPKFIDKDNLVDMLTYTQGVPPILKGEPVDAHTRRYVPPFDEFEVHWTRVGSGAEGMLQPVPGPSIVVVLEGSGTMMPGAHEARRGQVLFVPADSALLCTGGPSGISLVRATVNLSAFSAPSRM